MRQRVYPGEWVTLAKKYPSVGKFAGFASFTLGDCFMHAGIGVVMQYGTTVVLRSRVSCIVASSIPF